MFKLITSDELEAHEVVFWKFSVPKSKSEFSLKKKISKSKFFKIEFEVCTTPGLNRNFKYPWSWFGLMESNSNSCPIYISYLHTLLSFFSHWPICLFCIKYNSNDIQSVPLSSLFIPCPLLSLPASRSLQTRSGRWMLVDPASTKGKWWPCDRKSQIGKPE